MPGTSCVDVPCLDSQYDRDTVARVVRMPFALTRLRPEDTAPSRRHGSIQKTRLRPEGKCAGTLRPEVKSTDTSRPEGGCRGTCRTDNIFLDILRPEDTAPSRRHGCAQKENALTLSVPKENALTWLRPEGKFPDTFRPEGKSTGTPHPEGRCRDIYRPDAVCPEIIRPGRQAATHFRLVCICTGGSRSERHVR
jgi:hypothetical protein